MKTRILLAVCIPLLYVVGCAGLPEINTPQDPDEMFLIETGHNSQAEVALSELALERTTDPAIREYARKMRADHIRANRELSAIAEQRGLRVPKHPDPLHTKAYNHLAQLSGAQFDREYINHMVADHEKMVSMFEVRARTARDEAIRRWAAAKVPELNDHLEMARMIDRGLQNPRARMRDAR